MLGLASGESPKGEPLTDQFGAGRSTESITSISTAPRVDSSLSAASPVPGPSASLHCVDATRFGPSLPSLRSTTSAYTGTSRISV